MKKIILSIIVLFAFVGLQAQNFTMPVRSTYTTYTGTAADTIKGATSNTHIITLDRSDIYLYNVTVDIDTLAGGGDNSVSCILYGSNYNNADYWTSITDVTFAATQDTVFTYSDVSTGVLWRHLKLVFTGDGSSAASELQRIVVKIADKP